MVVVYTNGRNPMIQIEIVYSQKQSITNNSTVVSADVYYKILNSYGYGWNNYGVPFTLNIGGNKRVITWKFDLRNERVGTRRLITSHSATIQHNSSGYAPKVTMSVSADTGTQTFGNIRGSTSFTPSYIAPAPPRPAAPTYSKSAPFYAIETINVKWNNVARANNHALMWEAQNESGGSYKGMAGQAGLTTRAGWTKVRTWIRARDGRHPDVDGVKTAWQTVVPMPNAGTPSHITVPALTSGTTVKISWGASSSPNGSAVTYELQKKLGDGKWVTLSKGGRGTSFTDTITRDYPTLQYSVQATNSTGSSSWRTSPARTVNVPVPKPPTGLSFPSGITGGDTITIKWNSVPDADSYLLEKSVNGGAYYDAYKGTGTSHSEKIDVSVNTITYRIKATNTGGHSSYNVSSSRTVLKPIPTTPGTLTVSANIMSGTNVDISWGNSTVKDGTVTYRVTAYVNGRDRVFIATNSTSNKTSVYIPHTWDTVNFEVVPISDIGQEGVAKTVSRVVDHPAPTAPSSISVPDLVSGLYHDVSWGYSIDAAGRQLEYQLQVANNSGVWEDVRPKSPSRNATVAVLATEDTKRFRVRATNGDKWGAWTYSDIKTVYHPKPPSAPTSLNAPADIRAGKNFTVTWNAGTHAEKYHLYKSVDGKNYQRVYSGASRSYTDSVPKGSLTVQYRISSENVDGTSGYSFSALKQVQNFPEMKVKIGNTMKTTSMGWVKVGGVLREIDTIYVKVNGVVKEAN